MVDNLLGMLEVLSAQTVTYIFNFYFAEWDYKKAGMLK